MAREFSDGKIGGAISVRVTPRAKKNQITAILPDYTIKIKLAAPPVEGKANSELIKFLSDVLDVRKSDLEIVAGKTGRDKLISVLGLTPEEIHQMISNKLEK